MLREMCVLGFIGLNAWLDVKKQQISLLSAGVLVSAGIFWRISCGISAWQYFLSAGIGIFFLCISFLTRGEMGTGDGILIFALGSVLEPDELMLILILGMAACAGYAGLLFTVFHKSGKMKIPFIPFLLLGYVGGLLL